MREARARRYPSLLVFEDDCIFDEDLVGRLAGSLEELPDDWDMLFLGAIHLERPVPVSPRIGRLSRSLSTFAYALNHTVYDAFIELNERVHLPVDENNWQLQETHSCYCVLPHLVWVDEDYSDAQGREVNDWWLRDSLVLFDDDMRSALHRAVVVVPHLSGAPGIAGTLAFYSNCLPEVTVIVVEQGERPLLDQRSLRPGYLHVFLEKPGELDPEACFDAAYPRIGAEADFILFSSGGCCVVANDVRAALSKCVDHDFVCTPSRVVELDQGDTERLQDGEYVDLSGYRISSRESICAGLCVFTRRGLARVGPWKGSTRSMPERVERLLRTFDPPTKALRPHGADRGRGAD